MTIDFFLILAAVLVVSTGIGHLLSRYLGKRARRWWLVIAAGAPVALYILATITFMLFLTEDEANTLAMISAMGFGLVVIGSIPWIVGLAAGYLNPWTRGSRRAE